MECSMAFDKVDPKVDFPAQERATLAFWRETRAFDRLRELNHGKPKWSFLDGPITANNPMGVHHAWGRTYKDLYQRYFAGLGRELRYQNGFDCQGLWVEVEKGLSPATGIGRTYVTEYAGLSALSERTSQRVAARAFSVVKTAGTSVRRAMAT
jgi:isoleucyl-tRNA synthetase